MSHCNVTGTTLNHTLFCFVFALSLHFVISLHEFKTRNEIVIDCSPTMNTIICHCRVKSIETALDRLASYNQAVTVENGWVSVMQNKVDYLPTMPDAIDAAQPAIEATLVSEVKYLSKINILLIFG